MFSIRMGVSKELGGRYLGCCSRPLICGRGGDIVATWRYINSRNMAGKDVSYEVENVRLALRQLGREPIMYHTVE
jgi:hypothetical protein